MIHSQIHKNICSHSEVVTDWFKQKSSGLVLPFYSSFDIRDAGFKVAPVDANVYPAGFNNICQVDKDNAIEMAKNYIERSYDFSINKILIITEEHTQNAYYWENVHTLIHLMQEAGKDVRVSFPKEMAEFIEVESSSGNKLQVYGAAKNGNTINIDGWTPDLIISNNDFSQAHNDWYKGVEAPMNPPQEMGWYRRRKESFFSQYNLLAKEFSELIHIDPWQITVETEVYKGFDINSDESREQLAQHVDRSVSQLKEIYRSKSIHREPFVFVKNNSGTYGLAVVQAQSGEEIKNWNYKARKKMKAVKGGGTVNELIIQEGIPTALVNDNITSEPAIYMIGCQLAGGFLRTHDKKGPEDSLNSPGAVYKRLCVSDLKIDISGYPMENVYGWVACLGALAIGYEMKSSGVELKGMSY